MSGPDPADGDGGRASAPLEATMDPAVLAEVERLLTTTTFVTAAELVRDGGVVVTPPPRPVDRVEPVELPDEPTPLPRRR